MDRFGNLLFLLLFFMCLGNCCADGGAMATASGTDGIQAFVRSTGIERWPVVKGCYFDAKDFQTGVQGLVADVRRRGGDGPTRRVAYSRTTGGCHGLYALQILDNVPADLPDGQYVIAVRPVENPGSYVSNRRLELVSVLRESAQDAKLICTGLKLAYQQAVADIAQDSAKREDILDDLAHFAGREGCSDFKSLP